MTPYLPGAPALTLAASSGFGNGPFGPGWDGGRSEIATKIEKDLRRYDGIVDTAFVISRTER
jgi:hypothetical protein